MVFGCFVKKCLSHHRGIKASHGGEDLGHTIWSAVTKQGVGVGGVLHVGQPFSPGRGRDQPQEREDPSQDQILEGKTTPTERSRGEGVRRRFFKCPVVTFLYA